MLFKAIDRGLLASGGATVAFKRRAIAEVRANAVRLSKLRQYVVMCGKHGRPREGPVAQLAEEMTAFNPDNTWQKVTVEPPAQ